MYINKFRVKTMKTITQSQVLVKSDGTKYKVSKTIKVEVVK